MWRDWAANPMFFPPYELDEAAHSPPAPPPAPPPHGCRDFNFNPSLFMARRKLKRYRAKRVQMQLQAPTGGPGAGVPGRSRRCSTSTTAVQFGDGATPRAAPAAANLS